MRNFLISIFLVLFFVVVAPFTYAQEKTANPIVKKISPSAVVLAGEPLLKLKLKLVLFQLKNAPKQLAKD
ncbi:MAG: hypothetical protein HC778_00270 [Chamaesiphon sp. CSU_1_12]|nr:hypothetical protein [Chamaesiphon sp. CSU_1_12]